MRFDANIFVSIHTFLAYGSFLTALVVGCSLHYKKIVKNEFYGYPQEWWPSVSATLGDWPPERNYFQIGMALVSGPRLALVFLLWFSIKKPGHILPNIIGLSGLTRWLSALCWMFITSSDNHDIHDIGMAVFLISTLPWMFGNIIYTSPANKRAKRQRQLTTAAFFGCLLIMIPLYIQHKFYRKPGAYSYYACFEWGLILFDVMYDAVAYHELSQIEITISRKGSAGSASQNISSARNLNEQNTQRKSAAPSRGHVGVESTIEEWRHFVADVYISYCFWTGITGMPLMIYWFSVWAMGIGGHEAFLFANLSPALLGIRAIRSTISKYRGYFHLLSVCASCGCYLWHASPWRYQYEDSFIRLGINVFGVFLHCLTMAATWHADRHDAVASQRHALILMLGALLAMVSKFSNYGLNPLWPVTDLRYWKYQNHPTFLLALLACADSIFRQYSSGSIQDATRVESVASVPVALGLGGLFFSLHAFASDPGTFIAWVWDGYPRHGPHHLHGYLSVMAVALGIWISYNSSLPDKAQWWFCALPGLALAYSSAGWQGYYGGLAYLMFIASVAPKLFVSALRAQPGRTFFLAWLTYDLMSLLSIFCTAYAFVPYGNLVRERTDVLLAFNILCLVVGLFHASGRTKFASNKDLSTIPLRKKTLFVLVLLCSTSVGITFYRAHTSAVPTPNQPEDRLVTAGIWTIHFSLESDLRDSQRRVRDAVKEAQIDVLGLLESDLQHIVTGNRDLSQIIAQDLGYYVDLGPAPQKHTWGAALLSKFPIKNSTHHLLPSPHGELAPAISATLDVYGIDVDVIVVHNGQEEDHLDRQLQSQELGYVVTKPHADRPAPYKYLVEDGRMLDVEVQDLDRWCQYIFFRNLYRIGYARISRGREPSLTDTELQVARFIVPRDTDILDPSQDASRGIRVQEDKVLPNRRFSKAFYDGTVNNQVYHSLGNGHQPFYYPVVFDASHINFLQS